MLWIVFGTVGLLLLVACANVANLFLLRGESRRREFAVQLALGSGRARIAGQLLGEALTLSFGSGLLGIGIAHAGLRLLQRTAPGQIPSLGEISIDLTTVAFALTLAALASLAFCVMPIQRFTRPSLPEALKENGRGSSDGRNRHRTRNALVAAQVAVALVLLVGSMLMVRTFVAIRGVAPGFVDGSNVLTVRINIAEAVSPDPVTTARVHEQLRLGIASIPGVRHVAQTSSITTDGANRKDPLFVEGIIGEDGRMPPVRRTKWVAPGTTKRWATPLSPAATSPGPTSSIGARSRSFPRTSRANIGRRGRSTGWRARRHRPALAKSSAWLATNTTMDRCGPRRRWSIGRSSRRTMRRHGSLVEIRARVRNCSDRVRDAGLLRDIQQATWAINRRCRSRVETVDDVYRRATAEDRFALMILVYRIRRDAVGWPFVGIYRRHRLRRRAKPDRSRHPAGTGCDGAGRVRLFMGRGLAVVLLGLPSAPSWRRQRVGSGVASAVRVDRLDPPVYALAIFVRTVIGVLASWWPARQAAITRREIDPERFSEEVSSNVRASPLRSERRPVGVAFGRLDRSAQGSISEAPDAAPRPQVE